MKIMAFGDSITAAKEMNDEMERWPVMLQAALRERFPEALVTVLNAGVGGNTSREGLARMDRDVISHNPDCVLAEFGGNDAIPQASRHVPLDEFLANLSAMKAKIDAFGTCPHGASDVPAHHRPTSTP